MAKVALLNPIEMEDGRTAYMVEVGAIDEPFGGPAGREWHDFKLVDHDYATFEWLPAAEYLEDDDTAAQDAAECLPLPPWAEVDTIDEGGWGSGYEQATVILDEGHSLKDLTEYLNAPEAAPGSR